MSTIITIALILLVGFATITLFQMITVMIAVKKSKGKCFDDILDALQDVKYVPNYIIKLFRQ